MNPLPAHATRSTVAVYKIGGSLLRLPDLAERVRPLLHQAAHPVLFAGGGAVADVVREWHDRFALNESTSHALAMESLSLTSQLLSQLLPESRRCVIRDEVDAAWKAGVVPIIEPPGWFTHSTGWLTEPARLPSGLLPESWDVTSDTLAACVAVDLRAERLILVKSADPPADGRLSTATDAGLVDPSLSQVVGRIPAVQWVNLSVPGSPISPLNTQVPADTVNA